MYTVKPVCHWLYAVIMTVLVKNQRTKVFFFCVSSSLNFKGACTKYVELHNYLPSCKIWSLPQHAQKTVTIDLKAC